MTQKHEEPVFITTMPAQGPRTCDITNPTTHPSWVASHVKGGTTTSKNDELEERSFQDAEARRNEAAADKAASIAVPNVRSTDEAERADLLAPTIEQAVATNKALMYSYQPTDNPHVPTGHILVDYVNRHGQKYDEGEIDLFIGTEDDPLELYVLLFCPNCIKNKKHAQDCIITVRQSNRGFSFKAQPGVGHFDGRTIRTLGVIEESERFRCPQCSWAGRFDQNRIRTD